MTKREKEQIECRIKSNQLIAGQGIWECMASLKYKLEHSECIDNAEIEELLRKLESVKESIERTNKFIDNYISK